MNQIHDVKALALLELHPAYKWSLMRCCSSLGQLPARQRSCCSGSSDGELQGDYNFAETWACLMNSNNRVKSCKPVNGLTLRRMTRSNVNAC